MQQPEHPQTVLEVIEHLQEFLQLERDLLVRLLTKQETYSAIIWTGALHWIQAFPTSDGVLGSAMPDIGDFTLRSFFGLSADLSLNAYLEFVDTLQHERTHILTDTYPVYRFDVPYSSALGKYTAYWTRCRIERDASPRLEAWQRWELWERIYNNACHGHEQSALNDKWRTAVRQAVIPGCLRKPTTLTYEETELRQIVDALEGYYSTVRPNEPPESYVDGSLLAVYVSRFCRMNGLDTIDGLIFLEDVARTGNPRLSMRHVFDGKQHELLPSMPCYRSQIERQCDGMWPDARQGALFHATSQQLALLRAYFPVEPRSVNIDFGDIRGETLPEELAEAIVGSRERCQLKRASADAWEMESEQGHEFLLWRGKEGLVQVVSIGDDAALIPWTFLVGIVNLDRLEMMGFSDRQVDQHQGDIQTPWYQYRSSILQQVGIHMDPEVRRLQQDFFEKDVVVYDPAFRALEEALEGGDAGAFLAMMRHELEEGRFGEESQAVFRRVLAAVLRTSEDKIVFDLDDGRDGAGTPDSQDCSMSTSRALDDNLQIVKVLDELRQAYEDAEGHVPEEEHNREVISEGMRILTRGTANSEVPIDTDKVVDTYPALGKVRDHYVSMKNKQWRLRRATRLAIQKRAELGGIDDLASSAVALMNPATARPTLKAALEMFPAVWALCSGADHVMGCLLDSLAELLGYGDDDQKSREIRSLALGCALDVEDEMLPRCLIDPAPRLPYAHANVAYLLARSGKSTVRGVVEDAANSPESVVRSRVAMGLRDGVRARKDSADWERRLIDRLVRDRDTEVASIADNALMFALAYPNEAEH